MKRPRRVLSGLTLPCEKRQNCHATAAQVVRLVMRAPTVLMLSPCSLGTKLAALGQAMGLSQSKAVQMVSPEVCETTWCNPHWRCDLGSVMLPCGVPDADSVFRVLCLKWPKSWPISITFLLSLQKSLFMVGASVSSVQTAPLWSLLLRQGPIQCPLTPRACLPAGAAPVIFLRLPHFFTTS